MKYFQILYYKNGQKRSVGYFDIDDKIEAKNEVLIKTGKWISYYENGQLWDKGEWRRGERVGPWITYFNDGQLYFKGEYRNGSPEGPWMTYYQDGRLNAKGNYKNGKRQGAWVSYLEDGTVNKGMTGMFKNGKKISD